MPGMVLGIIFGIVGAVLTLLVLYLLFLAIAAAFYRRPKVRAGTDATTRYPEMVILIPAHDEALTLPDTLEHFKNLRLDRAGLVKPKIVVIADNCTDDTAELAWRAGVQVYERHDTELRGKGHAMRWAFEKLPMDFPNYQAVVIFDADTVPHQDFMIEAAAAIYRGVKVMQGRYDVLKPFETWRTSLMYIAFAIFNHIRPLGRASLGLSDMLKGNGMVFSRETLETIPWNSYSLVEDLEHTTRLVLAGIPIKYVPEAKLYGQAAATRKQATSQRLRWEGGRGAQARSDVPKLMKAAFKKRSFIPFDRAMDLIIPPLGLLVALIGFFAIINWMALWLVGGTWLFWSAALWLVPVVGIVFFVIIGLLVAKVPPRAYLSLLYAPFYVIWKLWIYFTLFTRRLPKEWVRTERNKIDVNDANQVSGDVPTGH